MAPSTLGCPEIDLLYTQANREAQLYLKTEIDASYQVFYGHFRLF